MPPWSVFQRVRQLSPGEWCRAWVACGWIRPVWASPVTGSVHPNPWPPGCNLALTTSSRPPIVLRVSKSRQEPRPCILEPGDRCIGGCHLERLHGSRVLRTLTATTAISSTSPRGTLAAIVQGVQPSVPYSWPLRRESGHIFQAHGLTRPGRSGRFPMPLVLYPAPPPSATLAGPVLPGCEPLSSWGARWPRAHSFLPDGPDGWWWTTSPQHQGWGLPGTVIGLWTRPGVEVVDRRPRACRVRRRRPRHGEHAACSTGYVKDVRQGPVGRTSGVGGCYRHPSEELVEHRSRECEFAVAGGVAEASFDEAVAYRPGLSGLLAEAPRDIAERYGPAPPRAAIARRYSRSVSVVCRSGP